MVLVTKEYDLIGGKWLLVSSYSEDYTVEKWYKFMVSKETLRFFRSLGGKETVQVFKSTSISPCKTRKIIRILTEKGLTE